MNERKGKNKITYVKDNESIAEFLRESSPDSSDEEIATKIFKKQKEIIEKIFGKEKISEEELLDAGLKIKGKKIEVESENVSWYGRYREKELIDQYLDGIEKIDKSSSIVKFPSRTKKQIKLIMKAIMYKVMSLDGTFVLVENLNIDTIRLLENLVYGVRYYAGFYDVTWREPNEVEIPEKMSKYLNAQTARNLEFIINQCILGKFIEKRKRGREYLFLPIKEINIIKDNDTEVMLKSLGLNFDLETCVTAKYGDPLAFIDVKNASMQLKNLTI